MVNTKADTDRTARMLARYMSGEDRYVRMATEVFGQRLAATQQAILRAAATNRRVLIVSGNGVGKSYAVAVLILCFLYSNPDSVAMLTSGTYSLLEDTTWKPMKAVHRRAQENLGFPGRRLDNPPKLETGMGEEWFFKAVSPTNPGSLEGRHASDILVVIEEADKPEITREHFDSAGSSITNANDRMVAVANPPEDEGNVVYEKMESDRWTVIQFSSFESHNVRIDAGELDADPIPGLVDLPTVAEDYEAWNDAHWPKTPADWPGASNMIDAIEAGRLSRSQVVEQLRDGLDSPEIDGGGHDNRWYRRRLGEIPPDDSTAPRPWTVRTVEAAERRWATADDPSHRDAMGVDVARGGGDRTAICEIRGPRMSIAWDERGVDHTENERHITDRINAAPLDGPVAIDAVGEGSALADTIRAEHPRHDVRRFNAGQAADDDENYGNARTEALHMLGKWLESGAIKPGSDLADELKAHARHCRYHEHTLRAATVYKATPKDDIKEKIDVSPDLVDAASLAAWADGGFGTATRTVGTFGRDLS